MRSIMFGRTQARNLHETLNNTSVEMNREIARIDPPKFPIANKPLEINAWACVFVSMEAVEFS